MMVRRGGVRAPLATAQEDENVRVKVQARQPRSEGGDGTRRTRLANERTYLAWLRSGFAAFAVSLGAGKVVPALTKSARWPYTILGAGFALVGIGLVLYGLRRQQAVERAISGGSYVKPNEKVVAALAVTIVLLGVVLLVIVSMR
jgi:putative membrane protein